MCCNVPSVVLDNAKMLICSSNDIYETTFGGIFHILIMVLVQQAHCCVIVSHSEGEGQGELITCCV